MNENLSKFTAELLFTSVIAAVLSLLAALGVTWVVTNIDGTLDATPFIYFGSGIIFGLLVGYKLNDLSKYSSKSSKKKK